MVQFRKDLEDFETYKIEKIASHNLGDNENRLIDWSGLLEEAVQEIALSDLLYYGDNQYRELLEAYATYFGVKPSQVVQGVGSDQMIHTIVTTFLQAGDAILTLEPDFFMYRVFSQVHGATILSYPLDWQDGQPSLLADQVLAFAQEKKAKLIILSNPNNPASIAYEARDLEKIVAGFEGIVVVDEAYIDFADVESLVGNIEQYENLIVLRTLSKAFGLAGLRLGFALSCERLAVEIDKVLAPYSMPNITAKIRVQTLKHRDKVEQSVAAIKEIRQDFLDFLQQQPQMMVLPSQANFVAFTAPYAQEIFEAGLAQDFNFKFYTDGPMKGYIRMGMGRPDEMKIMKDIISSVSQQQQSKWGAKATFFHSNHSDFNHENDENDSFW